MYIYLVIGIIVVIAIVAIVVNKTECFSSNYATLGSYGYLDPLFEPDVLRRCAAGTYMYTSNPILQKYCSTIPQQVLNNVSCPKAFIGRPLHMEYSSPAYSCNKISCGKPETSFTLA